MPFYTFQCTNEECNNLQEELQKFEVKETTCEKCQSKTKKKEVYFTSSIGLPNGHISFRDKNSSNVQKERTGRK